MKAHFVARIELRSLCRILQGKNHGHCGHFQVFDVFVANRQFAAACIDAGDFSSGHHRVSTRCCRYGLYGKKRLREIDRRIRFLTKRMEAAEVVDPAVHHGRDQVYFGAAVTYCDQNGREERIVIMGIDEADASRGQVSWIAPIARALLKARVGDEVQLPTPGGVRVLEVLDVEYPNPKPV